MASESILLLNNSGLNIPKSDDRVYKDECVLCFDNPCSESGIFVSLKSFQGFCREHVNAYVNKNGHEAFLHLRKVPAKLPEGAEPPAKRPTKLAIGVEGGFDVKQAEVQYTDENCLVFIDGHGSLTDRLELNNPNIPENVQLVVAAIITHQGTSMQDAIASWEDNMKIVSKHAETLLQLDNGVTVPPSGWKCSRCDLTQNLWMNLTDGTILCGRKYYDGSGGNNHALEYYEETRYPLAVKLGTITPNGADVFSYDEDGMVEDSKLAQHLEHFGINISKLEKTDKTMTELEIEANLMLKSEWDTIQESGKSLAPLYGPGYTGMINLGNSCYMNSVMQVLCSVAEFRDRYSASILDLYKKVYPAQPADHFELQMVKLVHGLVSGKYSSLGREEKDENTQGIRPQMFKTLIGKDHPEFASNRQQDAHEFLLHLLSTIDREERRCPGLRNIRKSFSFQFEDRIECMASKKVSYSKREDITLVLPIHLDKATNRAEYDSFEAKRKEMEDKKERINPSEIVRLKVPMASCLDAFCQGDTIDDFYSPAIKSKTQALRTTRFATFPDYLVVQMRKFTVGDDWVPKKLDVSIDVLEELDLSYLRSNGLQPGEEELPVEEDNPIEDPQIDESIVMQLAAMGFPIEGCKKAVYYTKSQGIESAMEWILSHSEDEDFAWKFELPTSKKSVTKFTPNEEAVVMIKSMGFTNEQATRALRATDNNLERAVDWIFSHISDVDAMPMETEDEAAQSTSSQPLYNDGHGKYKLFAFISHMGTSTSCGHYVCHTFKEGRWVIYNDRKVAVSEQPPNDLGYLYFYKRTNSS